MQWSCEIHFTGMGEWAMAQSGRFFFFFLGGVVNLLPLKLSIEEETSSKRCVGKRREGWWGGGGVGKIKTAKIANGGPLQQLPENKAYFAGWKSGRAVFNDPRSWFLACA